MCWLMTEGSRFSLLEVFWLMTEGSRFCFKACGLAMEELRFIVGLKCVG